MLGLCTLYSMPDQSIEHSLVNFTQRFANGFLFIRLSCSLPPSAGWCLCAYHTDLYVRLSVSSVQSTGDDDDDDGGGCYFFSLFQRSLKIRAVHILLVGCILIPI